MDKLKDKLQQLRVEADTNNERAEKAEQQLKKVQEELREKDNSLITATNKQKLLEQELSRLEGRFQDAQSKASQQGDVGVELDSLKRKIKLLENENTNKENQLLAVNNKLKDVENRAEEFERKSLSLEAFKQDLEKKNSDVESKYLAIKKELDETLAHLEDL